MPAVQTTKPAEPLAVRGETVYTMAGSPIKDGVVLLRDGKIEAVGSAADVEFPAGTKTISAKVVTPGLIDAHTIVGLQGFTNEPREQDLLEKSAPVQPELRAIDAFNGRERLIEWLRGFGITTIHTGPAPGTLISGQTMIIKTCGPTVDNDLLSSSSMLCVTLGEGAINEEKGKSPGTPPKEVAMLRAELIKAGEYKQKRTALRRSRARGPNPQDDKNAGRACEETLVRVLDRDLPLLITAHRAQDILAALKLAREFNLRIVLDGASESYLLIDQIKAANVPVIAASDDVPQFRRGREPEHGNRFKAARGGHSGGAAERFRIVRAQDASRAFRGRNRRRQWAQAR